MSLGIIILTLVSWASRCLYSNSKAEKVQVITGVTFFQCVPTMCLSPSRRSTTCCHRTSEFRPSNASQRTSTARPPATQGRTSTWRRPSLSRRSFPPTSSSRERRPTLTSSRQTARPSQPVPKTAIPNTLWLPSISGWARSFRRKSIKSWSASLAPIIFTTTRPASKFQMCRTRLIAGARY